MKKIYSYAAAALFALGTQAQTPVKKVLLEEFTTASCGNCPMMSKKVGEWHEANKDHSIIMVIHEGSGVDAMSSNTSKTIFNAMRPSGGWFAPAMMINRGVYPSTNGEAYLSCYKSWDVTTSPGIDSIATRLISEPAAMSVDIMGAYNPTTRTLDATVNVKFVSALPSGDWRINLFLVEDSVIGYPGLGPFKGWDQHCYDAQWAKTNYPGMFDGTSIIGYPHRHVMRQALLGEWGKSGVIPAIPVVGTLYTATTSIPVDTAFQEKHLSLIAFVSSYGANKTDKYILNANTVEVTNAFSTGTSIVTTPDHRFSIYPNPAQGILNLNFEADRKEQIQLQFTDLEGRTVGNLIQQNVAPGVNSSSISLDGLARGIYILTLKTADGTATRKIVID